MNQSSAVLALEQNKKSGSFRELLAYCWFAFRSAQKDISEVCN